MTHRTFTRLISVFILLLSFQLFASETDTLKTYQYPDSIMVIANRYRLPFKAVTNTIDEIPVKSFALMGDHSALQLIDMMSPSAFVQDKKVLGYGVGTYGGGSINMRGMGGKPNSGVLVLIDGRPDFMGIFGHPLPDVYGLDELERVDVIKGPSSTVFGGSAMAGIINMIPEAVENPGIRFSANGGSFNTYEQSVRMTQHLGKLRVRGIVQHKSSDGHLDSTRFRGWNAGIRLEYPLGLDWKMSLEGKYVPYEFDDPSMPADIADLGYYGRIRRGMADLQVSKKTDKLNNSFHLYTNLGHHRFSDGFESHDFSYGISSYHDYQWTRKVQVSAGFDALHYGGKAGNAFVPVPAAPNSVLHTINSAGGYIVGFYSPQSRWYLQGGIRYQWSSLDIQMVTPTAGISFLPSSHWKIFANYNQGFRLPTLQELFLFPPSNASLDAENVRSVETGTAWYFSGQNYLQASWYHNDIQNMIQTVTNTAPPPLMIFQNSGNAAQWGAEAVLNLQPAHYLTTRFAYSYLEPDEITAFNPRGMFKYYIGGTFNHLRIMVFGKAIHGLYADNYSRNRLPDYHLINLSAEYSLQNYAFTIQLRNLLDRRYDILPGYPAPGFYILAGINLNWNLP